MAQACRAGCSATRQSIQNAKIGATRLKINVKNIPRRRSQILPFVMDLEPSNTHAEPRNHSRHAMPRPLGYPRRTDLCDVKACAHPPGNTALTTEYWRSCEYTDDAALPTLGKASLYIMYQLRVAGDAVRTVFSVSRRPLQALEGCLPRCCCSTTPTALRGCASAEGRSHMVG